MSQQDRSNALTPDMCRGYRPRHISGPASRRRTGSIHGKEIRTLAAMISSKTDPA